MSEGERDLLLVNKCFHPSPGCYIFLAIHRTSFISRVKTASDLGDDPQKELMFTTLSLAGVVSLYRVFWDICVITALLLRL